MTKAMAVELSPMGIRVKLYCAWFYCYGNVFEALKNDAEKNAKSDVENTNGKARRSG